MKLGKLHIRRHHLPHISAGLFALMMLLGISGPLFSTHTVAAETLQLRYVKISDSTPSESPVTYEVGFTPFASGIIGSVSLQICQNYLFDVTDTCTPPPGFDASNAVLSGQTGVTDFSRDSAYSTSTYILLTRPGASNVAPMPLTFTLSNLTNPNYVGSMYIRMATYATNDGTGSETDYGNTVISTAENIEITTEVPPYLLFCTGITIQGLSCPTAEGSFINFGELSTSSPRTATSQMVAATNAPYGYSITLAGTTMTAGTNAIPALAAPSPSTVGSSQFGMNAVANSSPNIGDNPDGPGVVAPRNGYENPNLFKFQTGDIIASSAAPDDYRKTTISYIVNRGSAQPAGRYVATISYIALANF